ncbi:MAG TPA: acyltransferase [Puia sp.]|nr:acyltransferase [Puia sp.]
MDKRNSSLDFLRFCAVLLVMFRHLVITGNSAFDKVAGILSTGGWVGVDLFFVLSGFLVSGLIFKEYEKSGKFNAGRFLIRRGLKIYPAFYFFLLLTWGMTYLYHYASHESNMKYLYEALFICNYVKLEPIHVWLWSICVEEHFYFLLCILLILLIKYHKISLKTFLVIYVTFFLLGLGLRTFNMFYYPYYDFFRDFARSHLRFDALFFGVLLNYMYRKNTVRSWKSSLLTIAAIAGVALAFLFSLDDVRYTRLDTAVLLATNPLCFGYLMIRMLTLSARWMKPFAFVGKYSYPIYLFHGFINHLCLQHFSGWKYYIVYLLGALIIGIVVSKIIEYPVLALRDRWFPSASAQDTFLTPAAQAVAQ